MKKRDKLNDTEKRSYEQSKITDLQHDLLTVIESHIDGIELEKLFLYSLSFLIEILYNCAENPDQARKILNLAFKETGRDT
jgi:hypothetical protein